jgi:N-hydroxyarylamine O-acetyltransferase
VSADSDEWSVGKLDLDAYLRRIGYPGPADPSEATLTALYRAHLAAIRFENLGIFIDGGVRVDLESIQDKLVFRGRGGYCYEHAQLFGAVLERLGFGVERLLARVGPDGGPARPRTHLTLRVRAGQQVWLADPGFGSSPPAPLSLRRYSASVRGDKAPPGGPPGPGGENRPAGGPQEVDGWIYDVIPDTEHGAEANTLFSGLSPEESDGLDHQKKEHSVWKLREYQAGQWVTLHRWDDAVVQPVDVLLSNHYTSTHPDSWFTWQPVIVRRDPGAIRSILGRSYTVTTAGHAKTRRELTDQEFAAALTGEFALPLTVDEVAAAVAAPAGRDREPVAGVAPGT